ncbi:TIGR03086 family metal-binding protein [Mycetocola reblochoni]|uniref:Mycothiol-dependent maleylpyruvate isomerase metal-binding domain-containing protein n=2 Tax=Mycetocola reblochoni TaxID=331618 RepID=A0A1R4JCH6_9MICO|nr:TIGR03086 family metal-binding protein [Mycetocola reblochoni]RLP69968.1 TIGR03086 family protein [Mycetocola reblochoni]SJN29728.1 hypothetical protein FM119_06760 [Mycetocola reblochoni REB411]
MDHDWITLHRQAAVHLDALIGSVLDWSAPTPDEGWNVAELVSHVVASETALPPTLAGHRASERKRRATTGDPAPATDGPAGADLAARWRNAVADAEAAIARTPPTALVDTGRGRVPMSEYLGGQVIELTVHGWDLARAIGADETIAPELVEAVRDQLAPLGETLEASGLFAAAVPLGEDAGMQDRILALTGRDPRPLR